MGRAFWRKVCPTGSRFTCLSFVLNLPVFQVSFIFPGDLASAPLLSGNHNLSGPSGLASFGGGGGWGFKVRSTLPAQTVQSQSGHVLQHFTSRWMLSVEKYQSTSGHHGRFPCCFMAKPWGGGHGEGGRFLHKNKRAVHVCEGKWARERDL